MNIYDKIKSRIPDGDDVDFYVVVEIGENSLAVFGHVDRLLEAEKTFTDEHGLSEMIWKVTKESYQVWEVEGYDSFGDFIDVEYTAEQIERELNK